MPARKREHSSALLDAWVAFTKAVFDSLKEGETPEKVVYIDARYQEMVQRLQENPPAESPTHQQLLHLMDYCGDALRAIKADLQAATSASASAAAVRFEEELAGVRPPMPTAAAAQQAGDDGGAFSRMQAEKERAAKRQKKSVISQEATSALQAWWGAHADHPYPTNEEKAGLSASTGLTLTQVNNWFINQRKRHWRPSQAGRSDSD